MRQTTPIIATCCLLLAIACPALAQTHQIENGYPDTISNHRVELRQSINLQKTLPAGFDISLEENLREVVYDSQEDPVAYFSKSYTTIGIGYKMLSHESLNTGYKYGLKLDIGYTLKFNGLSLSKAHKEGLSGAAAANECLQHRPFAALTASINFGAWKLSLRETYRVNFRTDSVWVTDKWNPALQVCEKNPQLMDLRSRLKVEYAFFGKPLKLFAFGEATVTLNEPDCPWLDSAGQPLYGGQYLNGAKASLGARWRFDRQNALSISYIYDFKQDRDININGKNNANRQNVELTMEQTHTHAIVITYEFAD